MSKVSKMRRAVKLRRGWLATLLVIAALTMPLNLATASAYAAAPAVPGASLSDTSLPTPTIGTPTIGSPAIGTPTIGAPSVGSPTIGTPSLNRPTIGTPSIGTPSLPQPTVPEPSLADPALPQTSLPDTSLPPTSLPQPALPQTTVPQTSLPQTTLPQTSLPGTTITDPAAGGTSEATGAGQPGSPSVGTAPQDVSTGSPDDEGQSALEDALTWIKRGLGIVAPGGVAAAALASLTHGFVLHPSADARYLIASGQRFFNGTWYGRYVMSGRVPGTRYLATNPVMAKYTQAGPAIRAALRDGFNPFTKSFWTSAALKGAGAFTVLTTLGVNIYKYGWGSEENSGLGSARFWAETTDDLGVAALSTAAGAAGSALTGALAMATVGSVVPGVGTAVGFVVGLGVGWLLTQSSWGQKRTKQAIDGLTKAYKWVGHKASQAGNWVADRFQDGAGWLGDHLSALWD